MKRIIIILLVFTLVFLTGAQVFAASGPNIAVQSEHVYLYSLDTDKVMYEKNADVRAYPASLTKIMTCILALENIPTEALERTIVTYPQYVQEYLYNYQRIHGPVNLAGMSAGDQLSMWDLLHGLMVRSGNEIAMIIADHVGGSQENFVYMMNERAKQLGAVNTNFANASGLHDPENYSTARDMAIIAMHAMNLDKFTEISETVGYVAKLLNADRSIEWITTNQMIIPNSPHNDARLGLRGIKTGTLPETVEQSGPGSPKAGRCLITTARRDGFNYLLVTLGAPFMDTESGEVFPQRYDYTDTQGIYAWVFESFRVKSLVEKNRIVHTIPLRLNTSRDHLQLVTAERATALMAVDVDPIASVRMDFEVPDSVDAPIARGQHMGYVNLILFDEVVGRVELLAGESVEASRILVMLEQAKAAVNSFWFKFAVIFISLLLALYIALMIARNKKRRKKPGFKRRRRI